MNVQEIFNDDQLLRIQYLLSLQQDDFDSIYTRWGSSTAKERRQTFDKIRRYCMSVVQAGGVINQAYHHSLQNPDEPDQLTKLTKHLTINKNKVGRLFSSNSLQNIPREIRGFICYGCSTDIDMANAHPKILLYLCKKMGVRAKYLEQYCERRDEILSDFATRDEGKKAFLSATNSDRPVKTNNKFLKLYDQEMKYIQQVLTDQEEFEYIVKTVSREKTNDNWYGSAINKILCEYENLILQQMISTLTKDGYQIQALMFDGLMIYGDHYDNQELLERLENKINKRFDGLNLSITYKPHDTTLTLPPDYQPQTLLPPIVENDLQAIELLHHQLSNQFIYSENILFYRDQTYQWITDPKYIKSFLLQHTLTSNILKRDRKENLVPYLQSATTATTVSKALYEYLIHNNRKDNWFNHAIQSTKGKVLFNNGYFDIHNNQFIHTKSQEFQQTIDKLYFFERIDYDYEQAPTNIKQDIKQRYFYNQFGQETADYFLYLHSQGIAGDTPKAIIINIGNGNTGKSTKTTALSNTLGGYFGNFNGQNLYLKQNQDEAQALRWVLLLRTKRVITSNEIDKKDLNGNTIKKLSSGGLDEITGRLHGGNETSFKISFITELNCNDIGDIKPADDAIRNRLKVFYWTKVYTQNPDGPYELQADPNTTREIETLRFKQALFNILVEAYHQQPPEPKELSENTKDWFNITDGGVMDDFADDYDITNDPNDFVSSEELQRWTDNNERGYSFKKFLKELTTYTARYPNVKKKQQTSGARRRGYSGIKKIQRDDLF
jgi:phage/plasmid-associated DNA primase